MGFDNMMSELGSSASRLEQASEGESGEEQATLANWTGAAPVARLLGRSRQAPNKSTSTQMRKAASRRQARGGSLARRPSEPPMQDFASIKRRIAPTRESALIFETVFRNKGKLRKQSTKGPTALLSRLALVTFIIGSSAPFLPLKPTAASPPVDYFIYTSQLASAQNGSQSVTSLLPSLASIYAPPPPISSNRSVASSESLTQTISAAPAEQQRLIELANNVLRNVQNMSHQHDDNLIDLATTQYAWHLMERQAELYMRNRVVTLKPFIFELLAEAQVGHECFDSISIWLNELTELKQWAALMWNSWGQFPATGIFQGSYTDLGSYSGCMSIEPRADLFGEAQYCMLDFQPLVPARPRFHSIFKQILAHDPVSSKLTRGDFAPSPANEHITDQRKAHEFSSRHYRELMGSEPISRLPMPATAAAAAAAAASNKYLKRTIEQSPSGSGGAASSNATEPEFNITLKAEALIELVKRAQYFYYVKFRIGACLPSKCSLEDIKRLAQSASQRAVLQTSSVNCMKKEPFSINTYQLVAICILSSLALIALLGAIVDLLGFKEDLNNSAALVNWLLPFSIWTNARRLFYVDSESAHGGLESVHGLRFFSMLWVIYGHTILYLEYQSFTHFYDVVESQIPSFFLLPTLNANFSVDTFFVISGILTTYVTWEYTKGDARKFNKFAFLISRYIRLTPQLAIVILCFFILPLFGDGPIYKSVANSQAEVCYKNWLVNLLYMQSYINADKHCIDPSWWLSIEMTFHVVSIFVIVTMIRNPRFGMIMNALIAASFTIIGALIHYNNGFAIQYLPAIPQRYEIQSEQTKLFFHRPYPHAASYFIGIALGYILANKTIKKLTSLQVIQGWCLCATGLIVSLWGAYYWNLGAPYTQLQATLYYNLCQILWPISIAWIILACSLGHGGFVDSILSARCFVPLGRITYMTYLSHSLIIYYHTARMNIALEPSMMFFIYLFLANTCISLLLGIVLTVVYESPILNLQKQLFTYLTDKFDPTKAKVSEDLKSEAQKKRRQLGGKYAQTKLSTTESALAGVVAQANGSATSIRRAPVEGNHLELDMELADDEIDDETKLTIAMTIIEKDNESFQTGIQNGFETTQSKHNGFTPASATAQCLLLDANNDKRCKSGSASSSLISDVKNSPSSNRGPDNK